MNASTATSLCLILGSFASAALLIGGFIVIILLLTKPNPKEWRKK